MNNSVYEQIFRIQSVSDDYCVSSYEHAICAKWGEVQSFVGRYHRDKAVASRSINIFNGNAMCHFRNILKRRQKQITMDKFLVRQRPSGSEAESIGAKRQKKEKESPSKQQHFTSSPPSTYAITSPSYRYGKTKLSFLLYLIFLVLCLSFL